MSVTFVNKKSGILIHLLPWSADPCEGHRFKVSMSVEGRGDIKMLTSSKMRTAAEVDIFPYSTEDTPFVCMPIIEYGLGLQIYSKRKGMPQMKLSLISGSSASPS